MTQIELDDLTKRYGTETAIEDVSLRVDSGSVLAVVGPSGCGKSTTLRAIAGFESPSKGRVLFDGEDITGLPPQERNVGVVFQEYSLFDNMSVQENVTFGPRMRGVPEAERRERAEKLLELLGIGSMAGRRPASLSGGQQQRVGLARALAIEPDVLLLDEPMTGLDAKLKRRLRREMGSLLTELDVTTVYVTHDQIQAMAMADRIAVLDRGQVQQIGTPREVYERPDNPFVADFVGTSNLLDGTYDGNGAADIGFTKVDLDGSRPSGDTEDVTIVARPDDVTIADGPIDAHVVDTYYLGATMQVLIELPNGDEMTVNVDPDDDAVESLHVGERIGINVDPTAMHVIEST